MNENLMNMSPIYVLRQQINNMPIISHYMNTDQKRIIMKTFIQSQLGYCPLVWMFCSRNINARINRIHERS